MEAIGYLIKYSVPIDVTVWKPGEGETDAGFLRKDSLSDTTVIRSLLLFRTQPDRQR